MIKENIQKLKNTGFIHIFGSGFLNKIIAFASSYVLIKILPKTEYGVYSYAQNLINIFMIANGFGIASGLLQILCENNKDSDLINAYSRKSFIYGFIFDIILAFIIFIYSFFIHNSFEQLNRLLRFMMFIPLCDLCFELVQVYYRGTGNNKNYSYLSSINSILVLTLSLTGAYIFKAEGLILGRIISSIFTVLIACIFFGFPINEILHKTNIVIKEWGIVVKISFISMLNNSASIIMQNIDGILK